MSKKNPMSKADQALLDEIGEPVIDRIQESVEKETGNTYSRASVERMILVVVWAPVKVAARLNEDMTLYQAVRHRVKFFVGTEAGRAHRRSRIGRYEMELFIDTYTPSRAAPLLGLEIEQCRAFAGRLGADRTRSIAWYTREEIEQAVESEGFAAFARRYNVSTRWVKSWIQRLIDDEREPNTPPATVNIEKPESGIGSLSAPALVAAIAEHDPGVVAAKAGVSTEAMLVRLDRDPGLIHYAEQWKGMSSIVVADFVAMIGVEAMARAFCVPTAEVERRMRGVGDHQMLAPIWKNASPQTLEAIEIYRRHLGADRLAFAPEARRIASRRDFLQTLHAELTQPLT